MDQSKVGGVAGNKGLLLGNRRFLLLLGLITLVAYFAPIAIVRAPFYEQKVGDFWGPVLEYGFGRRNLDADVVVFGDSSAIFGFSPREVEEATGLKVVNLPNTLGSLPVTQDYALQGYLQHNKPPKLIVFYFSAWLLNYSHDPNNGFVFEGEEMLMRHGNWSQLASYLERDPESVLEFPLMFYSTVPSSVVHSIMLHRPGIDTVAAAHGHIDHDNSGGVMREGCILPTFLIASKASASAEELLQKYRSGRTQTVLYIAPVPACAGSATLVSRSYLNGLVRPPGSLPPNCFVDDGFYAHERPEALSRSTRLLVETLRPVIASMKTASMK
jgi:hypothetical protein